MSGSVARLRDVTVTIGGVSILDAVSLDIASGQHTAVLGPNGAGKTTLLRVLSTYRHPTRGPLKCLARVWPSRSAHIASTYRVCLCGA
jgi:ABC-type multidrug transport system ATPase subunit